jgi:hypothetical protein
VQGGGGAFQQGNAEAKTAVKVKVEVTYVSKGLSPQIPQIDSRKKRLRNNLKVTGCDNLLTLPWGYTSNMMLEEIRNRTRPREFQGLVRASSAQWTKDVIAEAFQVEAAGEGIPAKVALKPTGSISLVLPVPQMAGSIVTAGRRNSGMSYIS